MERERERKRETETRGMMSRARRVVCRMLTHARLSTQCAKCTFVMGAVACTSVRLRQ